MLSEFEKWDQLRDALRIRLSQAQAKEARITDDMSRMCCRYAQMTLKDIIRIMNLLEKKLCSPRLCTTCSALRCTWNAGWS